MSLLLSHPLADATAMLRGGLPSPEKPNGLSLDGLATCRLHGLTHPPGSPALDSDSAWESVVRSWWSLGLTWGLGVTGDSGECSWNLILPRSVPAALDAVNTHLRGLQHGSLRDFRVLPAHFRSMPFQAALAGHPGTGGDARLETVVRNLLGHDFIVLMLAQAVSRTSMEGELERLNAEEQFVRDEHLSRPGLEKDNHAEANHYLSLVLTARDRVTSSLQEGGWQMRALLAAADEKTFRHAQALIHGSFAKGGGPEPLRWQEPADPRKLTFLRSAEAASLTRPTVTELPGFLIESGTRTTTPPTGSEPSVAPVLFSTAAPSLADGPGITVGRILDDHNRPVSWLEIPIRDLCRHVLVAGMTGSGKSVTCEQLLLEIWREHRIPWLVIEPGMKTGYRRLLNSEIGDDLTVWAVGNPETQRLSMNPLAAPAGIGLAEHTSALFAVIASAFELVPPMPEVLATAIEQTYRNHGWDLTCLVPDEPPPTLTDLVRETDRCSRELGYGSEIASNIRAGLLLRLRRLLQGPLAPELAAPQGLDMDSLISRPTVIELSCLPDAESQALVMGLLTLQLRHHWRLSGPSTSPRHVTLIEEAHRLLRVVPETAANAARTRAVDELADMLAELRDFGASLVVVDQTPSSLVPGVIANTGTKILHRLDHPDDREIAGRAAGLPADQVDLLGGIPVGTALLRSDSRPKPFRLRVPNPSLTYGKLPLPDLPSTAKEAPIVKFQSCCPVCGARFCAPRSVAVETETVRTRIAAMLNAFLRGEEAAWQWALQELQEAGMEATSPTAPLCFLVSLAKSARLSPRTITRLHAALLHRTQFQSEPISP